MALANVNGDAPVRAVNEPQVVNPAPQPGGGAAAPLRSAAAADPALDLAVQEAGQHPERAEAIAAGIGVGQGRWFTTGELAELRGLLVSGGASHDDGALATEIIGPYPVDPESAERAPEAAQELGVDAELSRETCGAEDGGFLCDRPAGHTGHHVADCADDVHVWENEEEEEDTFEEDSVRFYTASSVHQTGRDVVLEAGLGGTLLLSVISAFCSHKDVGEYDPVPVSPLPHISGRAANGLLFRIDGQVHQPTMTGFRFTRRDTVEVDPERRVNFDEAGALVVGIVESNLRLLELREDGEGIIRLFDLYADKMLDDNMHLLIGGVTEVRHHYKGPQTAHDRAFDKAMDDVVRDSRARKVGKVRAIPGEFEARIERHIAEEAGEQIAADHAEIEAAEGGAR